MVKKNEVFKWKSKKLFWVPHMNCEEKKLLHRKVLALYVYLVKRNSTQQRRSNE
jgi:hypothetical protein